jgi:hypothetical protein
MSLHLQGERAICRRRMAVLGSSCRSLGFAKRRLVPLSANAKPGSSQWWKPAHSPIFMAEGDFSKKGRYD